MTREQFVETFGRLVQGPQWVAERAYAQRPFADTHDLRIAFQEALFSSDRAEQHDLLTFYPDLGSDAVEGDARSEESARDQGAVGLTLLNDEDHAQFAQLTQAYRERFGIPLIVSVRDVEKRDQILESGWERMQNSPSQEHAAAIIEVAKIANHRFDDLVADASPILGARAANLEATPPLSTPPGARQARSEGTQTEGLHRFNSMSQAEARATLASCLAVPRWIDELSAGRPYESRGAVFRQARASAASFTDDEIAAALARHPRIGEQADADHDAEFSEREQAAVGDADPAITDAIRAGNAEYESRFNRVFVIRATGRSATEILAELRRRLNNTPRTRRPR